VYNNIAAFSSYQRAGCWICIASHVVLLILLKCEPRGDLEWLDEHPLAVRAVIQDLYSHRMSKRKEYTTFSNNQQVTMNLWTAYVCHLWPVGGI